MLEIDGKVYVLRTEAAKIIGVNVGTVKLMIRNGVFGRIWYGNSCYIPRDEVERYASDIRYVAGSEEVLKQMKRDVEEIMDSYLLDDERVKYFRRGLFSEALELGLSCWLGILTDREYNAVRMFIDGVPVSEAAERMGYSVKDYQTILHKADDRIKGMSDEIVSYSAVMEELGRLRLENAVLRSKVDVLETGNKMENLVDGRMLIPLKQCGFNNRTTNCLHSAGIKNSGDILKMSRDEIMRLWGFGKGCMTEVENFINKLGNDVYEAWKNGVYSKNFRNK